MKSFSEKEKIDRSNNHNNNISNKINNTQSNKPKLYTFHDIINKNKSARNHQNTNKSNISDTSLNQSFKDIRVLNSPQFKSNFWQNSEDLHYFSDSNYITMPVNIILLTKFYQINFFYKNFFKISSGFGGYTTTRRIKQPTQTKVYARFLFCYFSHTLFNLF